MHVMRYTCPCRQVPAVREDLLPLQELWRQLRDQRVGGAAELPPAPAPTPTLLQHQQQQQQQQQQQDTESVQVAPTQLAGGGASGEAEYVSGPRSSRVKLRPSGQPSRRGWGHEVSCQT